MKLFSPGIKGAKFKKRVISLNGEKIITLPYADDFCLITKDLRKHQNIQNEIKFKIESMRMRLNQQNHCPL